MSAAPPRRLALKVVKFGGSVAETPAFGPWISTLAGLLDAGIVIVPGGGRFADAVRRAQAEHSFSDETGNAMALLAMEQYGRMLCGVEPALVPAASAAEIAEAVSRRQIPVWMPSRMLEGRPDVPATWDVTSDSLAAWLADAVGADSLTLIKSALPKIDAPGGFDTAVLAAAGFVDPAFPGAVAGRSFRVAICGPADQALFSDAILAGHLPGHPVETSWRAQV